MTLALALVLHAAVTWFLTGLIWCVQLVHYPLFAHVGEAHFVAYERRHTTRITWLVLPTMGIEVGLALLLSWYAPSLWTMLGLLLLAAIWASTFLLQVPDHRVLAQRNDAKAIARLVRTNWLRTGSWTARAGIAALLLLRSVEP